jgi:hypothetical protein
MIASSAPIVTQFGHCSTATGLALGDAEGVASLASIEERPKRIGIPSKKTAMSPKRIARAVIGVLLAFAAKDQHSIAAG